MKCAKAMSERNVRIPHLIYALIGMNCNTHVEVMKN